MTVFIVRWAERVDGEEACGNLDKGYLDPKKAEKKILDMVEKAYAKVEPEDLPKAKKFIGKKDTHGCTHFCSVQIEDGTYDYWNFFMDEIEVK